MGTRERALRRFRFATGSGGSSSRHKLLDAARRAEDLGYSSFCLADHFMIPLAPLVALQAVADATTTLRVGQSVLAQGFRHPAVLAKELATLDVLSEGRLEIGIGAGWMRSEFEQAGLPFEAAPVRIERMEEAVTVLKGLFSDGPLEFSGRHFSISGLEGKPKPLQQPHPPIMVGGGGPRMLAAAARHADIVQVLPGAVGGGHSLPAAAVTASAYRRKVELIAEAAGERFGDIELSAMLMQVTVTDDVDAAEEEFLARFGAPAAGDDLPSREDLLASPVVAVGPLSRVCDKLRQVRDELGFSYFTAPVGARPEQLAPVIAELAGT